MVGLNGTSPQRTSARRPMAGDSLQVATEVSLVGVTAAAIAGMHLLFADGSFFGALLLQALIAHLSMAVLRRMRLRLLPAALVTVVVAAFSITWIQYLDTTFALLPSPDTLSAINAHMNEAWRLFQDVRAPAPVVPGFIVTTSMAVWVIVFIADWGAFRTGVSFEALLPPATLFLFAAVLGEQGGTRTPGAALFVAAALVFLLLHRTWRQEGTATWAAVSLQRGRWSMLTAGMALAAIPVIASALVGPNLPGADDPPVVPWRKLTDEEQARVVISPLVDIRSRLVTQTDTQLFTVQTDDPAFKGAYWRMTALDDFDGTIWRSTYDTTAAGDDLPTSVDDNNTTTTQVTQTITIQALDVIWLPGAYQPISFQAGGNWDADFDRDSGTLIVDKKSKSSDGLTYTVVSEIPTPQREELRSASPNVPGEIIDRYTDLPKKFPAQVTNLAERLTADKETEYDKALAIMDYLRNSGTFEYNKETVRPGHDDEALVDFLFTSQEGYCEQFAGSFAALARSVGLPTRVAVGFTPGEQDPREPTLWKITGRQAHAWAEVYFEGYGWVIFDPTPGRAPTGAESWLGVQPAQELPAGIQTGDSAPSDATTPGATDPSSAGPAPGGGTPGAGNIDTGGIEVPSPQRDEGGSNLVPKAMGKAARPLGYGFLGYLVLVPLLMVGVRSFRRLRARAPAEKVDLAWREANEEAAESGIKLNDSLTVAERALRMRAALPDLAPQIDLVARWVEQVHYAEASPTSEDATLAAQAAAEVVAAANRRQVWYVRLLRYFDIRRLMPRPDHARRSAQSVVRTALRTN